MDNTNPYLCIDDPARRTIVVGDIHGCWTEFQQLLDETSPGADDLVITVGDFMDRGPGSWDVARYFKSTPNAFSVKGNHERRVAGVVKGNSRPAWSQKQSLSLLPETEHIDWAEWMESLPAVIETPHSIITHARLDPTKPIANQDLYFMAAVGGAAVTIELDGDGVPLWFRQMRLEKPVCMGHIRYDRVVLEPDGLYALDTGAVRGGKLTAVIFPGGDIVQVPVQRNYHDEAYKEWQRSEAADMGDPMSWTLQQVKKALAISHETGLSAPNDVSTIEQTLTMLDLERRGKALKCQLMQIFGHVPPPGVERGEFFISVKKTMPDISTKKLVVRLLQEAPLCFDDLVKTFPKARLCDINGLLTEFERTISGIQQD